MILLIGGCIEVIIAVLIILWIILLIIKLLGVSFDALFYFKKYVYVAHTVCTNPTDVPKENIFPPIPHQFIWVLILLKGKPNGFLYFANLFYIMFLFIISMNKLYSYARLKILIRWSKGFLLFYLCINICN